MKRVLFCILLVVLLFSCSCTSKTADWQTIHIEDCGTLKIPNEWSYWVQDNVHYITEGETPIMISYRTIEGGGSNIYFKDYKYIDFVTSAVLSNSAGYGKAKYLYEDDVIELYYLELLYRDEWIEFAVWDSEVSKELLIEIAKTYVHD